MPVDQVLYARQPIVNRDLDVYGYELLFRTEHPSPITDGNFATSQVLLNAFTEGDIEEFMKGGKAFVNFTQQLLLQPPPFDKESLIIEILEDIEINAEVMAAVESLHQQGFTLALDDYVADSHQQPLLPYASIVKLEFPAIPKSKLPGMIDQLQSRKITVLAEKIETQQDFKLCNQLGCDLFQGYFFSKPEIVRGRKIPQSKLAIMKLIAKIQNPRLAIDQIIQTISQDPLLSVKLLQMINSVAFRRPQPIDSIHMAVMLLGIERIKTLATLLALSNIDGKPNVLIHVALTRAHMCKLMAHQLDPQAESTFFTVGLFSCLEGFFDQPLKTILSGLPLDEKISDALLKMKGKPGLALNTVLHYERGNFESIHWKVLENHQIDSTLLTSMFKDSIQFASDHTTV